MKNIYRVLHEIIEENKSHTPREILEILDEEIAKGTFGKEYQENGRDLEEELRDVVFDIAQEVGMRIFDEFEEKHNTDLGLAHKDAVKEDIYVHFDEWDEKIEDFYKIYYGWIYKRNKERMRIILEEEGKKARGEYYY